ncbi:MurT ligase domain-containing protein [Parvibacter caecicola]|uniref:Multifunctional fusion protein n=1 Tax=Parvibacter caecicola TaxID=747645 RepID=A0A7W5GQT8_9ACTN|nr:MurT ligase domain-containing protein [Parvibacter caecicola]MBB3171856.1 CobQ-like glutamine amidotransferase family enzyme/UDP-N-acetylmuramyl tripeptide synthase [Parvibacter caecicola]MCR2040585.1 MurT ligase domain-containing protein [Parvibacter caecicola]RNL09495.1 DUF1727 domain-containing protein [Parvibacter caecicola]
MSLKTGAAQVTSAVLTWGLRHVAHRPAANLPGDVALKVDPAIMEHLRGKVSEASVMVVGTNGKTSVSNLLADALQLAGKSVICNRTGANLASGIATALLQQPKSQWGVFECDELWLAEMLPQTRARYVLLLNLFRDQLDRCGEIRRIQDSIIGALASSPETVLVYNGDDPLCARIAAEAPNRSVAYGVQGSMGLAQNTVADAQMCQHCGAMVQYRYRQYGQLGDYFCPQCGFSRPQLACQARAVEFSAKGVSFEACDEARGCCMPLSAAAGTPYLVYNYLAIFALLSQAGVKTGRLQQAISQFNPGNGRLQSYQLQGRPVLLNLAKNPTGFNQNLKIITQDAGPKAVAFFINDQIVDGRDISWIWDIDFEELAGQPGTAVFAGGSRKNDLQVRLKYAGLRAQLVEGIEEVFSQVSADGQLPADAGMYAIANYTALPVVHQALDAMAAQEAAGAKAAAGAEGGAADAPGAPAAASTAAGSADGEAGAAASAASTDAAPQQADAAQPPVVIAHLFPDLLNLYGDGGNVRILQQRLAWRGVPSEVRRVEHGQSVDLADVDLVFMGGGPDREQKLASEELLAMRDNLAAYVEADGPLLAICGGYQILGHRWLWGDELVEGLSIVDLETRRPGTSADRLVDNLVLESPLAQTPVVGYENHAGHTYLGEGVPPFGKVISQTGAGNNEQDQADGVRYRNVVGTYSHGPLLSKNPEVADWLLSRALERRAQRTGTPAAPLAPLNDAEELQANHVMQTRLGL